MRCASSSCKAARAQADALASSSFLGLRLPRRAATPERTGRGDVVLVFDVADADAVHATMQRAGAKIIEPPQVYTSKKTAPDGSPLRGKVFHVRDPDGYLIELLQAPR